MCVYIYIYIYILWVTLSVLWPSQNFPTCRLKTSWSCRTKWELKFTTRSRTAATRVQRPAKRNDWTRTGEQPEVHYLLRQPLRLSTFTRCGFLKCVFVFSGRWRFQPRDQLRSSVRSSPSGNQWVKKNCRWQFRVLLCCSKYLKWFCSCFCVSLRRWEILDLTTCLENTNRRFLRRRINLLTTSNTERKRWEKEAAGSNLPAHFKM